MKSHLSRDPGFYYFMHGLANSKKDAPFCFQATATNCIQAEPYSRSIQAEPTSVLLHCTL